MDNFVVSLVAFIVAIGVLVTIHEFGHFYIARRCGVKVLRFSIGFGRALWKKTDKFGTEFVIAMIPLGGFVKMLDEREGFVPNDLRKFAFNNKTVWQRIAIVLAGPLANFIFAIFLFTVVNIIGTKGIAPIIDAVQPNSIADISGFKTNDEIISIGGKNTQTIQAVILSLFKYIGTDKNFPVEIKHDNSKTELTLNLKSINTTSEEFTSNLGIQFSVPKIQPIIGEVMPNQAAQIAGFKANDKIISVNNQPILDWQTFVRKIQALPGQKINVKVKRADGLYDLPLIPQSVIDNDGKKIGAIGVKLSKNAIDQNVIRIQRYNLIQGLTSAVNHTTELSLLTLKMIGKMLTGQIDLSGLSGPIGIAQGAGQSIQIGSEYYLAFLGLISVSLGVINLLPIPLLDGGHLLYFIIEIVTGKAISQTTQQIGSSIGLFVLIFVMGLALYNDFVGLSS